jgi:hypothetical protein
MSALLYKRTIPMILVFVIGMVMVLNFFTPIESVKNLAGTLQSWGVLLTSFAILVSVTNFLRQQVIRVSSQVQRWPFFIWTVVVFLIYVVVGITYGQASAMYMNLFNLMALIGSVGTTSMVAHMWAGVYRTVRVTNLRSFIVLFFMIVIMLRQAPITAAAFPAVKNFGDWVYEIPTSAGLRAVIITIGLGMCILGIRVLLGYERAYLGETAGGGG